MGTGDEGVTIPPFPSRELLRSVLPPTTLMEVLVANSSCCWFGIFPGVNVCELVGVKKLTVAHKRVRAHTHMRLLTLPSFGI